MRLDRNYFNSIELEPVKKKYYSLSEVDNLLVDIRAKALEMNEETEKLQKELAELKADNAALEKKAAFGKAIYDQIIRKAQEDASDIINKAKDNAKIILQQAVEERKQTERYQINLEEEIVTKIASAYEKMKRQSEESIAEINEQFQSFLVNVSAVKTEAPDDLSDKVKRIAQEMQAINFDLDDDEPLTEETKTVEKSEQFHAVEESKDRVTGENIIRKIFPTVKEKNGK